MMRKFREPVSGLTHAGAAVAAMGGLFLLLIVGWGQLGKTVTLAVYGISLVLMFAASATYHLAKASPTALAVLRRIDHTAIYLLIAGTYTPYCYIWFTGFWRWGMLAIVWSLALIGIVVKLWTVNAPRWLSAGLYVAMGWLCLIGGPQILASVPPQALFWLALGGVIYTLGAVVYVTKTMNFYPGVFGFHEVWHIFVMLGALAHYIGMLFYVAPA
jgi:hemolysin III